MTDADSPTLAMVRRILFALLLAGLLGTEVELLLLKHTDGVWQVVPVLLIGAGLLVAGWVVASSGGASLRALRMTMWIFVLSGLVGLVLHFRGNIAFEQESDPSIAGVALLRRAVMGATPTLAPGTMIQLGLVGLVYLFRHPRLVNSKRKAP
jgi:hypothetical protein